MDLLGFKNSWFATHSVAFPFHPSSKKPVDLRYGAARAHNRHMAEFCSADDRLMGVGIVPLDDPAAAIFSSGRLIMVWSQFGYRIRHR